MGDVLQVEAGDALHLTGWSVDGALGAFVELESTVPGSPYYLVNDTAGVFTSGYLIISDAQASADALWTADATCADFGGNAGWFDAPSPACGDRLYMEPGDTLHATGWSVDGAPGANILLTSYPPSAAHFIVADSGGPFTSDYLNILLSEASPDADWTADANCFDAGGNVGWFGAVTGLTANGLFALAGPAAAAAALVASPGVGGVSVLGPAVSGVLVQGVGGIVFVPLSGPGAAGVGGAGVGVVAELVASLDVAGLTAADISAHGQAAFDVAFDGFAGEVGLISAWGQASVLAPAIAAALVEACRVVGELETAELHWHGYSRRGRPYLPILTRIADWPSPQTLTLRWAAPQIFTITWEGGPWPD
jgi:hypothetical protein